MFTATFTRTHELDEKLALLHFPAHNVELTVLFPVLSRGLNDPASSLASAAMFPVPSHVVSTTRWR